MANEIDTTNKFLVGTQGKGIFIMNPPRAPLNGDDAMLLAAYLVLMAQATATNDFADVVDAVQNT